MWLICTILLSFFPMINFSGIKLPTLTFILPLMLFQKHKLKINDKFLKVSCISTILFFLLNLIVKTYYNIEFENLIYPFILIYTCILYFSLYNIFLKTNKDKMIKILKLFIIIQFIFCLMQITNFMNTNQILERIYFFWQQVNAGKNNAYLEISYRPFGTTGNPVYTAIICYIFGQTIFFTTKDKKYYYLSFIIMFLCGARMSLLAFLFIEIYMNIIKNFFKNPLKSIIYIFIVVILSYLGYLYIPFIQKYILMIINGDSNILNDYSITYRLSMFNLFKTNGKFILFGGIGIENLPSYVDCEYILRILQFGVVGFILYIIPYIDLFKNILIKSHYSDTIKSIIIFIILMLFTSIIITNIYIVPYIIMSIVIMEKEVQYENNICNN